MLTKEQKRERREKRDAERAAELKKFPGSRIHYEDTRGDVVQLIITGGQSWPSLEVRVRDKSGKLFSPSLIGGSDGWKEAYFRFNVEQLAEFIAALSARLDYALAIINTDVDRINVTRSERLVKP